MTPTEALDLYKITMTSEFVPFSKSRNAKEKNPSLNWIVTFYKGDAIGGKREIIKTDYMSGCGHCPAYKNAKGSRTSLYNDARIRTECEKGFPVQPDSEYTINRNAPIIPKIEDVFCSLLMDADALDAFSYEGWSANTGYDPDSRAGEKIYRACLDTALKLRNTLGEADLAALREAFADY